jgi:hypothetical protein
MAFTALVFAAELLLILFPGLVMHHALARRVLMLDADKSSHPVDELQLLGFGILPGLALANTVATLLAIVHAFYWWSYLALVALLVGWLWRDALATLSAIGAVFRLSFASLLRGNLMLVVAVAMFLQTGTGLMLEAQLPSGNIDVWHHNLPLAQSIVSHHGFVMPQLADDMFYGSYPIFIHMFFAQGLLFFDSVIAAKAANAMIYLGFLVSLLAFARHARAVAAVLVAILIIDGPFFTAGATDAMTDIGRVCFSALAFAFGYQYFRADRVYFLLASGLVAGGAIAGKYTELLTPILIGIALLAPLFFHKPHGWRAVWVFVAATAIAGAYPYLRNLILLHNPIYPFLFAHPGISDESMKGIQTEVLVRLANPAFAKYSQNLLSPQGWRDLALAANELFLSLRHLSNYMLALTAAGLVLLRSRELWLFALWTLCMWVFWYTIGQMNPRWGMTPLMLLLLLAYLALVGSIDRCVDASSRPGFRWRSPTGSGTSAALHWVAWMTPAAAARIVVAIWAIVIGASALQRVSANGISGAYPPWLNRDLARSAVQPGGLDAYLVRTRPGYEIYRYIGDHDLRMVLQPFDNAGFFQIAYNGGKNGNWLFPWYVLPAKPDEFDAYLRNNGIRYFVYCPTMDPSQVQLLGNGSYNPRHAEIVYDLMRYILPGSRLILTDSFGWELREMSADGPK